MLIRDGGTSTACANLPETDDGLAAPHLWCMGFLAGMRLRMDAWRPLLDLNRIGHGLMFPILLTASIRQVLCSDHLARDPRPESFSARCISRLSRPRSGSSGCQNGCARGTLNAKTGVRRSVRLHLIIRLLKHVALTHHARPDRGTNGRRPRDRGNDPYPGSGRVLEADRLSRGGKARLNVGFVFSRRMIALDGWIVITTSRTEEQGGHDQRDMEQFQCVDVRPPASD
jgi:hypothetical protein